MSTAITGDQISKHIAALVQANVATKQVPESTVKGPVLYASIFDEAGALVSVIAADTAAAGSTGASLSKIPPGAVQDLVRKAQPLDEDLLANYHEVANVLTVLTTAAVGRRTILRSVTQGASDPAITNLLKTAKNKLCLQVTVQGYPPGTLMVAHV